MKFSVKSFLVVFAILVMASFSFGQTVHQVEAGTDGITAAYANAADGDVIELTTSGGIYHETDKLLMVTGKSIVIMAADDLAEKPVWRTASAERLVEVLASIEVYDIKMTGFVNDDVVDALDSTKYAFRAVGIDGDFSVYCENVDFDYFYINDGTAAEPDISGYIYRQESDAPTASSIHFKDCKMSNVGGYGFRMTDPSVAPGQFGELVLENCTFDNFGSRILRTEVLEPGENDPTKVEVNHCTFNDCGSQILRVDDNLAEIIVKNSIFFNTGAIVDVDAANVMVVNCDTLNTGGFSLGSGTSSIMNLYDIDPGFADVENGDFTVDDFNVDLLRGHDGLLVGDLDWDPQWQADGIRRISAPSLDGIHEAYAFGNRNVELVTSGGEYLQGEKTKVKKSFTIKASDGLAAKPVLVSTHPDRPLEFRAEGTLFMQGFKITGMYDDGVTDANDSTKYAVRVRDIEDDFSIVCYDMDFDYFFSIEDPEEGYGFRFDDDAVQADSVVFRNCMFTRCGWYGVRLESPTAAPGQTRNFIVENCTFSQIGVHAFALEALNETGVPQTNFELNHITFGNMIINPENTELPSDAISLQGFQDVEIKNSIFAGTGYIVDTADGTTTVNVSYYDDFNTQGFDPDFPDGNVTTSNSYDSDPEFTDAANFDFTVSDFFAGIAVGDDGTVIGDSRWVTSGIGDEPTNSSIPSSFELKQNYPNPFNATTVISYNLPATSNIELAIFNVMGQKVATLYSGMHQAGVSKVTWMGKNNRGVDVPSGVYFCKLSSGDFSMTRKMLLVK